MITTLHPPLSEHEIRLCATTQFKESVKELKRERKSSTIYSPYAWLGNILAVFDVNQLVADEQGLVIEGALNHMGMKCDPVCEQTISMLYVIRIQRAQLIF